ISEDEEQIIQTIKSRCQILRFPPLGEAVIAKALVENYKVKESEARTIAIQANGSYSIALNILNKDSGEEIFEGLFIKWVRTAFRAKGNKASIIDLIAWSEEIAAMGREGQKSFLLYCIDFFRQAL